MSDKVEDTRWNAFQWLWNEKHVKWASLDSPFRPLYGFSRNNGYCYKGRDIHEATVSI